MPLSLAEEAALVVGIDPFAIPATPASGSARARCRTLHFALADGMALPFGSGSFDLVLSHAVIEHVADAPLYLRECARVLAPGGRVYLSTAPYLSFAGAHLPRLKVPIPLHILAGRRVAFATFRFLARHAPWSLREPANENSFIKAARRGEVKHDDLLELVRVRRLRAQIAASGLRIVREELHATATVRRMPSAIGRWLRSSSLTQDALISNMEYVSRERKAEWLRSTGIGPKTAAASMLCTAASSVTMPLMRAGCDGSGSTGGIPTTRDRNRRSGSRTKGRRSSASTRPCRCGCRSPDTKCKARGAWT